MESKSWKVSELWIYRIKSCKGTMLQGATIGVHGIVGDRQFMVVDAETGMFVAQRSDRGLGIAVKSMCQITPTITDENGTMELSAPGMRAIRVFPQHIIHAGCNLRDVQVWDWKGEALFVDAEANAWFTEFLSRERPGKYQLVMFPYGSERRAKLGFSQLRFADGYPFLVISQESLNDFNVWRIIGGKVVPMDRFRPNIVISGGKPYDEDRLDRMGINGGDFEGKTLCVRCPITITDQETAERGKEPLATLATYRRSPYKADGGVVFGRNFNHLSTGIIRVGDEVTAISYSEIDPLDRFPIRLRSDG